MVMALAVPRWVRHSSSRSNDNGVLLHSHTTSTSLGDSSKNDSFGSKRGRDLLETLLVAATTTSSSMIAVPAKCGSCENLIIDNPTSIILKDIWMNGVDRSWISHTAVNKDPTDTTNDPTIVTSDPLTFGKCQLHGGRGHQVHYLDTTIQPFFAKIFGTVQSSMASLGYNTELSRYDLFHGHLFTTSLVSSTVAVLGCLFHCYEYPRTNKRQSNILSVSRNEKGFDSDDSNIIQRSGKNDKYDVSFVSSWNTDNAKDESILLDIGTLGYCQEGSTCSPSLEEWRFRNVLWNCWWPLSGGVTGNSDSTSGNDPDDIQQALWHLDGTAPEIAELRVDDIPFGPSCPNTVFEGFLGENPIGDLFYLDGEVFIVPARYSTTAVDINLL